MIFALAYNNLARARELAALTTKSDWNLQDLLAHYNEQDGDSKILASELLLKHFSDELSSEMIIEIRNFQTQNGHTGNSEVERKSRMAGRNFFGEYNSI
jgi:hypothetical protein